MVGAIVAVIVVLIGGVLLAGRLIAVRSRRLAAAEIVQRLAEPARERAQLSSAGALLVLADQAARRITALTALGQDFCPASAAPRQAGLRDQLDPLIPTLAQLEDVAGQLASAQTRFASPAESGAPTTAEALTSALGAAQMPDTVIQAAGIVHAWLRDEADAEAGHDANNVLTQFVADGMPVPPPPVNDRRGRRLGIHSATSAPADRARRNPGQPAVSLVDQARAMTIPADPHGQQKRDLLAAMTQLGLDTESPGLRVWADYSALLAEYDSKLRDRARGLAEQVATSIASEFRTGVSPDQSPTVAPPADAAPRTEVAQCIGDLALAAERYGAAVSSLLVSAGLSAPEPGGGPGADAARQSRAPLSAALTLSRQQLSEGNSGEALIALTAALPPVGKSWPPSQEFSSACAAAARRLGDVAAAQCAEAAQTFGTKAEDFVLRHGRITAAVSSMLAAWATDRDGLWNELRDAAHRVQRETARSLVSPTARHDVTAPVEAAAAMLGIQELTAAGLGHAVRTAIPVPGEVLESHTTDPHLHRVGLSIDAFDRAAVALAGIDGLLSPLLSAADPKSGAELAGAMRQFAPVPRDIHLAYTDLARYLAHPETGLALTQSAGSVIGYAREGVITHLPDLPTDGGFIHFLGDGVHTTADLAGIVHLLGPDGSLAEYGVERMAESVLGGMIKTAERSPLIQLSALHVNEAATHVGHAAAQAAPALLHGVAAHVPYVTLVLSVTREIRIQREYKTSLDEAVKGIALDVSAVSGAIVTGDLLAHLLGLHAAVVTIPVTILARLGTRKLRRNALEKAQNAYATQTASYETRAAQLTRDLEGSLQRAMEQERAAYRSRIDRPEPLSLAAAPQLGTIVRGLQAMTAAYAQQVRALLGAEQRLPGTGIRAAARAAALRALDDVKPTLARCDEQLKDGRVVEALMTVASVRLPVTDAWSAGRLYQENWAETVARLRALEDQHWRQVATWATDACKQFGMSERRLAELATTSIASYNADISALKVGLDQAAKVVEVRSAQLHGRRKH